SDVRFIDGSDGDRLDVVEVCEPLFGSANDDRLPRSPIIGITMDVLVREEEGGYFAKELNDSFIALLEHGEASKGGAKLGDELAMVVHRAIGLNVVLLAHLIVFL